VKSYFLSPFISANKIFLLFIIFLFSDLGLSQSIDQGTVASVGNDVITSDEFVERYELTPQLYTGMVGAEESLKKEFLYSIIAEKLWALEAESLGLDKSELIMSTYKAIEKMYVRDALYREEILDKVHITDEYLTEAYRRNSLILNLNYIYSTDFREINEIYEQLKSGVNFYSILLKRPESKLQEVPYSVSYGQMDKTVEDKLYNLMLGEITEPVKAPNGLYIFKLLSIQEKTVKNVEQAKAEEKYILKVAEQTITDSLYKAFFLKFFNNVKAETNKELLHQLSDLVSEALRNENQKENISSEDKMYLTSNDLYQIEKELGPDKLNAVFIRLDDQPETIDDFLQELAIEKFYVDSLNTDQIMGRLNYYVRKFIEHELLAREGYKRGLQNLPEVRRDLNIWKGYYLSEALRREIIDSIEVTDEEVNEYFIEKCSDSLASVEVKIVEVLTDDLDVIQLVLNELNNGKDFRELAVEYTIREEAKNNNGELGYFNINQYGEIGRKAATLNVGDMYGPIKVPEGYSLFELIDRKELTELPANNYNLERVRITAELKNKKYSDAIINKTIEFANKYNIKINEEIMNSIKVLNMTTVVYRNFGFGGKLLAIPMTVPNYNWVKPWLEQKEPTP
jgi:parvulin-like peptidyl-prolyl isomerase